MATLITPGAGTRDVRPANGRTFELEELRQLVGGYIEALRLPGGGWAILNEEGKLDRPAPLPYNATATQLLLAAGVIASGDYIAGTCVLCTPLEAGEGVDDDDT